VTMKTSNYIKPPRIAEWMLKSVYSDKGEYTHLEDFREVFNEMYQGKGFLFAWLWYWFQVIRSLRGLILNKIYWSTLMFKNYLVISFRNIIKNKWFSMTNIIGLAVGMACFILILAYVQFEMSFDRFHEKADSIHLVIYQDSYMRSNVEEYSAGTPELLAKALTDSIPEIVNATRIMKPWTKKAVLQNNEKSFYETGLYADGNFLSIFSFPLIKGNKIESLASPNSIVISESAAKKLFGNEDPIGKTIEYKERHKQFNLHITGVLKNPPPNSHLQFDYLISVPTLIADKSNSFMINTWDVGNFITYVEVKKGSKKAIVEGKFPSFLKKYEQKGYQLYLQPLKDIHLRSHFERETSTNNEMKYIYLFISIAFVILLIACINYMNLATARAVTRSKEIGIRKVAGANRTQLFKQFIGESFIVALLALGIALVLIKLSLPYFCSLVGIDIQINYLHNTALMILLILTVMFVGIASGSYPAIVLSALKPVSVLRDFVRSGKKGSRMRNIFVVVQFSASIILIIGTIIIFGQMNYIKTKRLGYDREHVVVIPIRTMEAMKETSVIKTELLNFPEVEGVSVSGGLPTNIRSRLLGVKLEKDNGEKVKMQMCFDYVDYDFLDVFKIELLQGRNFSREYGSDKNGVIFNETAVKKMGWEEPLGKKFSFMREDCHIIGVVKDFYFASLHSHIEPMFLSLEDGSNIAVRLKPGNVPRNISLLKETFEKNSHGQPFDFYFLDDAFNQLYRREQRTGKAFGYFAILAVLIACLGLLGLSAFTVEQRTKEIGIRKVLGASIPQIMTLLTKEFVKLVVIANVIAFPVAYFAMSKWLQNFAYHISISPWMFILAAAAALGIAFLTISYQTFKAAASNPVDTLRYE